MAPQYLHKKRVLFILKQKETPIGEDYSVEYSVQGFTTGLLNSATYVSNMLNETKLFESKVVIVKDNNSIDKEVTDFDANVVIIEALWVVPSKFEVLTALHPKVQWIIRLHSELPFIANEGVTFDWLYQYLKYDGVYVAVNSERMEKELEFYLRTTTDLKTRKTRNKIIYLPNYYPTEFKDKELDTTKDTINISCFGAIRPLKNHLIQAFAAIMFAEKIGKKLNFHINTQRVEQRGESVLRNLIALFESYGGKHTLVEHEWYEKDKFLEICSTMDIGMQCSLSETFNLVTADLISQGIPVVTSEEIQWVDKSSHANPTDSRSIANILYNVYRNSEKNCTINKRCLKRFTKDARQIWINYLSEN